MRITDDITQLTLCLFLAMIVLAALGLHQATLHWIQYRRHRKAMLEDLERYG